MRHNNNTLDTPFDDGMQKDSDLGFDDGFQHNIYKIKDQDILQQDAVPLEFDGQETTPDERSSVLSKQIPKVALNFTKWKLQQKMTTDLRQVSDPGEVALKVAKYTECFDILDKLGADNCVDPEDFDQEDMDDDHFKNLMIVDIEEMVKENNIKKSLDQDRSPAIQLKDCLINEDLEFNNAFNLTEDDVFLLDHSSRSDTKLSEGDIAKMDFENDIEKELDEIDLSDDKAETQCEEDQLMNKFRTQNLEEVRESSEESDQSSMMSYNIDDLASDCTDDQEILSRVKVADDIDLAKKNLVNQLFGDVERPPIPFVYDFEDLDNCKLNIELKKIVNSQGITIPIVKIACGNLYLVGTQKLKLQMQGQIVNAISEADICSRLNEYLDKHVSSFEV